MFRNVGAMWERSFLKESLCFGIRERSFLKGSLCSGIGEPSFPEESLCFAMFGYMEA